MSMQSVNAPALAGLANPKFPSQLVALDEVDRRNPCALRQPEVVDQDRIANCHVGEAVTASGCGL